MSLLANLVETVLGFLVGLLVGGVGIHVGAGLVVGEEDLEYALWTALYGAIGWAVGSLLVGWIPLLGAILAPVLALGLYLLVVNLRYPGGWLEAAGIAAVAWLASWIVLSLLRRLVPGTSAVGVPFV